jgi:hypothetical protein
MRCGVISQRMSLKVQIIMFHANCVLAVALLTVLAVTMVRRHLRGQLPAFFVYVVFNVISTSLKEILFATGHWHAVWYEGWADDLTSVALGFVIIFQISSRLFASYVGIWRLAKVVMRWSVVGLVVAGALLAVFFHDVAYTDALLTVFLLLDRSLRLVQLGLIVCLFALSSYLHLQWKNFLFGVALGFGFFALMILTGHIIRFYYGQPVTGAVGAVWGSCYCLANLIWLFYAFQPEAATLPIVSLPSHELEKWDLALSRLLGLTTSSSIPAGGE